MAIRIIEYTVTADGISPIAVQQGGVQGEHNATEVRFVIDSDFFDVITEQAGNNTVFYHFEAYNGIGNKIRTEPFELKENTLVYQIENSLTQYGGNIRVILAIIVIEEDTAKMITYSYPANLKLKNRPDGKDEEVKEINEVSVLVASAKVAADTANRAAGAAELFKDDADNYSQEAIAAANESKTAAKEAKAAAEESKVAVEYTNNTFSNALKGTASGRIMRIDDISPIEHDLGVTVSLPTTTVNGSGNISFQPTLYCKVLPGFSECLQICFILADGTKYTVQSEFFAYPNLEATISGNTLTVEGGWGSVNETGEFTPDETVFQQYTVDEGAAIVSVTSDTAENLIAQIKPASVTVTRLGKNLLDYKNIDFTVKGLNIKTENGALVLNGKPSGEIYASDASYISNLSLTLPKGTYTFSMLNENDVVINSIQLRTTAGAGLVSFNNQKGLASKSFTLSATTKVCIAAYLYGTTFDNAVFKFQLEVGSVASDIEPFSEAAVFTPNIDGTVDGVKSIYPTTVFKVDPDSEMLVTYNRDINKAFAELITAVQTLGGII